MIKGTLCLMQIARSASQRDYYDAQLSSHQKAQPYYLFAFPSLTTVTGSQLTTLQTLHLCVDSAPESAHYPGFATFYYQLYTACDKHR